MSNSEVIIDIRHVSKRYHLGQKQFSTLNEKLQSLRARIFGAEDPNQRIGKRSLSNLEEFWALKDVSFEVRQGDILAIIGRNGAGKSTLLKILSRVSAPTSGAIKYRGRLASLLEVGTGFHPELTGRENIYLNGQILGMKLREVKEKFNSIVEFSEVERFIDTPVKRYSSGMYVKLAFSVAAFLNPEIFLIDEVIAVGDLAFQEKCMGKMSDLAKQGRTLLFVSHNIGAVSKLCNRAILLNQGQLLKQGSVSDVLQDYFSLISQQNESLASRTDREGTGDVQFLDAWLENDSGDHVSTAMSGEDITFVLKCQNQTTRSKSFYLGVGVTTELNLPVTDFHLMIEGQNVMNPSETALFRLRIPRLSLNSGTFLLNLIARDFNTEVLDFVLGAFSFKVARGLYYSDDRMLTSETCLMSMDYSYVKEQTTN